MSTQWNMMSRVSKVCVFMLAILGFGQSLAHDLMKQSHATLIQTAFVQVHGQAEALRVDCTGALVLHGTLLLDGRTMVFGSFSGRLIVSGRTLERRGESFFVLCIDEFGEVDLRVLSALSIGGTGDLVLEPIIIHDEPSDGPGDGGPGGVPESNSSGQ